MKSKLSTILILSMLFGQIATGRQAEPDPKRKKQIMAALVAHGYTQTKTWSDTVLELKQIAREHGWQSKYAPDARVLILLGLGNEHSDPAVLDYRSHLDPGFSK